jgi:hypothetical protein
VTRPCLHASQIQSLITEFDSGDLSGDDQGSEVDSDGPGTAANVEHGHPRRQVRQEITGRVLRGAPAMRAQHRFMMPMGVNGPVFSVRCPTPYTRTIVRLQTTASDFVMRNFRLELWDGWRRLS